MLKKKLIIILFIIILMFILIVPLKVPEKVLKMLYPIKYENFVELYANQYNVDKYLIYAVIKAESNFDENAVSSKGAKGLMQLMDNTAKYVVENESKNSGLEFGITTENVGENLLKPQVNIMLGTKYISILIDKYNSIQLALVAYNAGSGNVDNWIEQGILNSEGSNIENVPYKETNNYVRKILRDYEIYRELY